MILIVARNSCNLTMACVKSALAQDIPTPVLVLDNASIDGTAPWLRSFEYLHSRPTQHYPAGPVTPLRGWTIDAQLSLAACWNKGIREAWALGETACLVLNNDTVIRPDTYRLLSAWPGPFVTGISVRSIAEMEAKAAPTSESPHPDFSCFLIRKEVTDKVGWFDEDYYPAYCEDCQFHVRMHRAGIPAVSIDLPFLHYACGTLKTADPAEKSRIERGAARNKERFRETYGCYPDSDQYGELFKPVAEYRLDFKEIAGIK